MRPASGWPGAGSGTVPTALANADATARVGSGAVLTSTGGAVEVTAYNSNDASAESVSLALSFGAAFGVNVATAEANGATTADMQGGVGDATSLLVRASALNDADAQADSATAGIVTGNGAVATARANGNVTASVGAGAGGSIDVDGNVTIEAISDARADAETFGASFSGLAALGVMVADAEVTPDVTARVTGPMNIAAGGAISVVALHNAGGGTAARADADSPSGGLGGAINGVIVDAMAAADTLAQVGDGATLTAGGTINVSATASNRIVAFGDADTFGTLFGVGALVITGEASGSTRALMDGDIVSGSALTISAAGQARAPVVAEASAGSLGIAANATVATATSNARVDAGIAGAAQVNVSGNVSITAVDDSDVSAEAYGTSFGLVGDFGVGLANATNNAQVDVRIGAGARVDAGGDISVRGRHNATAAGNPLSAGTDPQGDADLQGARAVSYAPGGSLGVSGKFVFAKAIASADVDVHVDGGATLYSDGDIVVEALSVDAAKARPLGASWGLLAGFGATRAEAIADGSSQARMNGSVGDALTSGASTLTVNARGHALADAKGKALAGGILGAGSAATAIATSDGTVNAMLGGNQTVRVSGDIAITAHSVGDADAVATGSSLGSIAAGGSVSDALLTPTVGAIIGSNAHVRSIAGHVLVSANHNRGLNDGFGARAYSSASSGGLLAGSGADADATITLDLDATIGSGSTINAGDYVRVEAIADNYADAEGSGTAIGLGSVGVSVARANIAGSALTAVGAAQIGAGTDLVVYTQVGGRADAEADAASGGILGGGQFNRAAATYSPTLGAQVNNGAAVSVGPGRAPDEPVDRRCPRRCGWHYRPACRFVDGHLVGRCTRAAGHGHLDRRGRRHGGAQHRRVCAPQCRPDRGHCRVGRPCRGECVRRRPALRQRRGGHGDRHGRHGDASRWCRLDDLRRRRSGHRKSRR
jgi:hypothetical protein